MPATVFKNVKKYFMAGQVPYLLLPVIPSM
jgi:hypothetical protein